MSCLNEIGCKEYEVLVCDCRYGWFGATGVVEDERVLREKRKEGFDLRSHGLDSGVGVVVVFVLVHKLCEAAGDVRDAFECDFGCSKGDWRDKAFVTAR